MLTTELVAAVSAPHRFAAILFTSQRAVEAVRLAFREISDHGKYENTKLKVNYRVCYATLCSLYFFKKTILYWMVGRKRPALWSVDRHVNLVCNVFQHTIRHHDSSTCTYMYHYMTYRTIFYRHFS